MLFNKRKLELLLEKIELAKVKKGNDRLYSIFNTKFFNDRVKNTHKYSELSQLYDYLKNTDDLHKIPYEVGLTLDRYANDLENVIGITRLNVIEGSYNGYKEEQVVNMLSNCNVLNDGIEMGKVEKGIPYLNDKFKVFKELTGYLEIFKKEKDFETLFLCSFPKNKVNDNLTLKSEDINGVYNIVDGKYVVPAENIIGIIYKNNITHDLSFSSSEYIKNRSK